MPAFICQLRGVNVGALSESLKLGKVQTYVQNGGPSKLTFAALGKTGWTGRNWNTVTKLLEMAASLET